MGIDLTLAILALDIEKSFERDAARRDDLMEVEYRPQPELHVHVPMIDIGINRKAWQNKYENIGRR